MRKLVLTLVFIGALAMPASAFAQTTPSSTAPATVQTTAQRKPWGRLAIFIPLSVLLGAAVVFGRNIANDRSWRDE